MGALVGGPPVVFLDEPTTGLDPETKRNIWALIDRFKRDRCVILTTHSMDEADALCSRIGIMSHGRLRCIGENLHLKNVYGNGYKVDVRYDIENQGQADAFMRQLLPEARLEEAHPGVAVYQIQKQGTRLCLSFVVCRLVPPLPASRTTGSGRHRWKRSS